jgi:RNA polymerase sigma factor (sigma-70 family)
MLDIGTDTEAFEAFYRRHVRMVTGFLARRVLDPHLVDDLTTEVFLAAIETADRYRVGLGGEAAWLVGIARNIMASERRRSARQLEKDRRAGGRRHLAPDDIERLEERIDAERAARHLMAAVAHLPERLRAVLELVDVDGLSIVEAAAILRIRPGTARVRLHRARRLLTPSAVATLEEAS